MTRQASSASDTVRRQLRTYSRAHSAVFLKTKEEYGGLSNMAGGFPLRVNGLRILTSEALYQACRFPHRSDLQRLIIAQSSPMTAKMKSKPHRRDSRQDWDRVRVGVMRWCLRVKLAQHWDTFSRLLLSTENLPIVEQSRKDDFWGAKPAEEGTLRGVNALGRLLMELRELVRSGPRESLLLVEPLQIRKFLLAGRPIERVVAGRPGPAAPTSRQPPKRAPSTVTMPAADQLPLTASSPGRIPTEREDSPEYLTGNSPDALRPYPAYRDSGIEWIGEVPVHWQVLTLRHVLRSANRRNRADLPLLSVVRDRGVVVRNILDKNENHNFIPDDLSNYKVVTRCQFVINKMKAWQGSYGVSSFLGIVSPAYYVFDVNDIVNANYFHMAIRSHAYVPCFTQASDGVRIDQWDLSLPRMREILFLVPPISEQVAVVRFLDHVDRRIQRYVRAKQKLIAVLEEQNQVVIEQSVTGRIDVRTGRPYAAYKLSRVEWLGQVPEHWDVAALRHRYSQCLGKMLDAQRITGSHSVPYLRNVDVQWDRVNVEDLPVMDIAPEEYERYTLKRGDLLVCEGGEMGRSAIWSGELARCGFQKALHRLRPRCAGRDVPRFMHYALHAAVQGNAFDDGHLSTIAHLTGEKLRTHRFPFPPVEEQESLVTFLDTVMKRVNRAISGVDRQIELLREYRTRLISDVVTGKLDVREAAAGLPEVDSAATEDDGVDGIDRAEAAGISEPVRDGAWTESDAADGLIDERRHAADRERRP